MAIKREAAAGAVTERNESVFTVRILICNQMGILKLGDTAVIIRTQYRAMYLLKSLELAGEHSQRLPSLL